MRKLFAILIIAFAPAIALAQYTTITGTHFKNAAGALLASGSVCFQPADNKGNPLAFNAGGGDTITSAAVCRDITTGVIQTTYKTVSLGALQLADTTLSNPTNVCYQVRVVDNATGQVVVGKPKTQGYDCFQPSGVSFNFDTFVPSNISTALVSIGPTGAAGPNCDVASPPGQCVLNEKVITTDSVTGGPVRDVRFHGAKGDGATDDVTAIQAAITAAASGSEVYFPPGTYRVCSGLPILVTKPLNIHGSGWGTIIQPCAAASGTTDVFLFQPAVAGVQMKGFRVADLQIVPQSGTPGRYGLHFDGTNKEIYDGVVERVYIAQLGSAGIYAEGSGESQGTPVLTTFRDSVVYGGLTFTNAGDTIRIVHNQITGTGKAIDIAFQAGASTLIVKGNNITSHGGIHLGTNTVAAQIEGNEIETFPAFTGSNGAVVDCDGAGGGSNFIVGNSFQIVNGVTPDAIRINACSFSQIYGNHFGGTVTHDIILTGSPGHTFIGTNDWGTTDPTKMVSDGSASASWFTNGRFGVPLVIPNNKFYSGFDDAGTVQSLLGIQSDGTSMLFGFHGRKALGNAAGATYIYDGTSSNNIGLAVANGASSVPASGTTVTANNLATITTPVYDARAYASVQAAIDAANAANGGVVLLQAHSTNTGLVTVKANVTLRCVDRTSVLTIANAANTNVVTITGSNSVVENCKIDGNKAGQSSGTPRGIHVNADVSNVTIRNNEITNTYADGVRVNGATGQISNVFIRDNYIHDVGTVGVLGVGVKNLTITGNLIRAFAVRTTTDDAMGFQQGAASSNVENLVVTHNTIVNTVSTFFGIESAGPTYATVVNGCLISDNLWDGGGLTGGNGISGYFFKCTMTGNTHINGGGDHRNGYEIDGLDNVISGNTIFNGMIAIAGGNTGGASGRSIVSSNYIVNSTNTGAGIQIGGGDGTAPITDMSIDNNSIYLNHATPQSGIYIGVYGTSLQVNRIAVRGNRIFGIGGGNGIRLLGASGTTDIYIANNTATGLAIGYLDGANANATEVSVVNNDFRGNTTPISHSATGTFRIWENITTASQTSLDLMNGLASVSSTGVGTFAGVKLGTETFTASPRMIWSAYINSYAAAPSRWGMMKFDKAVTVTRLTVAVSSGSAGCTTNPVVAVTDSSNAIIGAASLTLSPVGNGTYDSGAISVNLAAGTEYRIAVTTASAGCSSQPGAGSASVQYMMQ